MAVPKLSPSSITSAITLPETGSLTTATAAASYPLAVYVDSTKQDGETNELYDVNFISGAVDQVNYTYRKLGGDVLDIEITEKNVFAAYEEAVLEYSTIINLHQAKNTLGQALGNATGSFDQNGQLSGTAVSTQVALRYPRFDFGYARQVADAIATEVNVGGTQRIYSASIAADPGSQDYDLQALVSASANDSTSPFYEKVGDNRVFVKKVFFKTPHSMWRFYGYFGGLNTVGNLSTYGMYADDSTFEVIPVWQNKMQAMAYEDAIYTRNSHYSYEIKNNRLRIFPKPIEGTPTKIWIQFSIQKNVWETDSDSIDKSQVEGINNLNTLPFNYLPFGKINSMGKQWIRRYALALCKEMLAQIRGKFGTIPIPGSSITMNASDLLSQAKDEQEKLKSELKTTLDDLTYQKLVEQDAAIVESAEKTFKSVPLSLYVG